MLSDWQIRVVAEQENLSIKITRLSEYISENSGMKSVSCGALLILSRQLKVMCEYNEILIERINEFDKE